MERGGSVALATVVLKREELGPERSFKGMAKFTPVPCGDHLSPSKRAQVAQLQEDISDVFSHLPGYMDLIQHHSETPPGVVVCSLPYQLPKAKKMWLGMNSWLCSACE